MEEFKNACELKKVTACAAKVVLNSKTHVINRIEGKEGRKIDARCIGTKVPNNGCPKQRLLIWQTIFAP